MEPYKEKLIKEYWETVEKINSLSKSLENEDDFKKTSGEDGFNFAQKRLTALENYRDVLSAQIETFEPILDCHYPDDYDDGKDCKMIDRDTIIRQAVGNILREMFRKSQPSGDYDEYVRKLNEGEIKEEPGSEIYKRHYLSREEYEYIVDKYVDAYGMRDKWNDYFDILIDFLGPSGKKEVSVKEDDFPSRREYCNLPEMVEIFKEKIKKFNLNEEQTTKLAEDLNNAVLERVNECREFYNHDREEHAFRFTVGLMCPSPTCNKEEVKKYWTKQGANIEIVEHDPETFWEKDYYGNED